MKTFPLVVVVGLLALGSASLYADGRPGPPPPRPPSAPVLRPDASPVAQLHVDTAQTAVKAALAALIRATTVPHGGYVEKAMVEVNQASDDLTQAAAYLKAHPEANTLPTGPAPAEKDPAKFTVAPAAARGGFTNGGGNSAQTNMLTALDALNAALNEFMNPVGSTYKGPVMGDLGGLRKTIMDDLVQANSDVLGGINYANGSGVPATPAPAAKATAADNEDSQRLPSAMAGLALSAAFSLGGLHIFSRNNLAKG